MPYCPKQAMAEYLSTVTDPKIRKSLTNYRLSEHSLAVERGCHRQTWLPREDTLYPLHPTGGGNRTTLSNNLPPIVKSVVQPLLQRHRKPWCPVTVVTRVVGETRPAPNCLSSPNVYPAKIGAAYLKAQPWL